MALTDELVERYARHLILKGVGVKGQKRFDLQKPPRQRWGAANAAAAL